MKMKIKLFSKIKRAFSLAKLYSELKRREQLLNFIENTLQIEPTIADAIAVVGCEGNITIPFVTSRKEDGTFERRRRSRI